MNLPLAGQVALVTGGGKGIGLAIARAVAARGARVAITGRNLSALTDALPSIQGDAIAVEIDVRKEDSIQRGMETVMGWGGSLDILVNNAGIGLLETPLMQTSAAQWRDVLDTNLTGAFLVTQAVWPALVSRKGQVLNVSSIAGVQGFSGATAYCASKHGLNGLTEALKKEAPEVGIRILAICPGAVDTDIWDEAWASKDHRSRMMTPDQIGDLSAQMLCAPRNLELNPWIVLNSVSPWA